MKQSLTVIAIFETATGLALIIAPSIVGQLLFGAEFTGVANPEARMTTSPCSRSVLVVGRGKN